MPINALGPFFEPVSSLSHFIGALVCVPCSLKLLRTRGLSAGQRFALYVFCGSCIGLLTMSGVYHLLPTGPARDVLQRLDHAAIFVLIAGTFTPIHVILFRGGWRWGPLFLVWLFAVLGIVLKTMFFSQIPEAVGISMYLGMGWMGAASGVLAWYQRGFAFILPLLSGSVVYSAGTVFEFVHQPILIPGVVGPHELFHLMVLGGMAFHWKFISSLFRPEFLAPVLDGEGDQQQGLQLP